MMACGSKAATSEENTFTPLPTKYGADVLHCSFISVSAVAMGAQPIIGSCSRLLSIA